MDTYEINKHIKNMYWINTKFMTATTSGKEVEPYKRKK